MRQLFSILLILTSVLLLGCAGPAITNNLPDGVSDKRAPEKATEVVVNTKVDPQTAYKVASQVLLSNGYAIDNSSAELLSITTKKMGSDPNGILAGTPKHRISVSVRENLTKVVFQGSEFGAGVQSKIKKYGQSGSPQRLGWKQLVTVAHKVSTQIDGELTYEK